MFPRFSSENCRDGNPTNRVEPGEGARPQPLFMQPADVLHVRFSQLGSCLAFALSRLLPVFGELIYNVVGVGPQEKVRRPHTSWRIALMKAVKAAGDCAERQNPGRTVGEKIAPVEPDDAIACHIFAGKPEPMSIRVSYSRLVNLWPEAVCEGRLPIMPMHKAHRLAQHPAFSFAGLFGNRRGLATAAFAQFGELKRKLYNIHADAPITSISQAPAVSAARGFPVSIIPYLDASGDTDVDDCWWGWGA